MLLIIIDAYIEDGHDNNSINDNNNYNSNDNNNYNNMINRKLGISKYYII